MMKFEYYREIIIRSRRALNILLVGLEKQFLKYILKKIKLYDIDPLKMLIKMNCKTTGKKKTLNEPPRHKTNALKTAL